MRHRSSRFGVAGRRVRTAYLAAHARGVGDAASSRTGPDRHARSHPSPSLLFFAIEAVCITSLDPAAIAPLMPPGLDRSGGRPRHPTGQPWHRRLQPPLWILGGLVGALRARPLASGRAHDGEQGAHATRAITTLRATLKRSANEPWRRAKAFAELANEATTEQTATERRRRATRQRRITACPRRAPRGIEGWAVAADYRRSNLDPGESQSAGSAHARCCYGISR